MMSWLNRLLDKKTPIVTHSEAADSWASCAVGEINGVLRQHSSSAPRDKRLYHLGFDFTDAVETNNRKLAFSIYQKIVARAARLARI